MKSIFKQIGILVVVVAALLIGDHVMSLVLGHPTFHGVPLMLGVTLNANVLTLLDWGKRQDPDGKVADIVELLSITNEILLDMLWMEGNLPTGHRTTIRTGLPTVAWRLLNQGVQPSKSTTAQIDEACGIMEAWSEVDKELAELSGNVGQFRFSEAQAFIEAMNQQFASTLFYGNAGLTPEQFTGLSVRYAAISGAANKQNIIDGGGTGSVNTSVWLILWGRNTVHGLFPKGSKAGLQHFDHGEETIETVAGVGTSRMRGYRDQFQWKCGIAVRDWRYGVRFCNIDTTNLTAQTSPADLIQGMIKMVHKIPTFGMGKASFYMNRTVFEMLDIQRFLAVKGGGQLHYTEVDGVMTPTFRGIPIRRSDSLLNTEARVV